MSDFKLSNGLNKNKVFLVRRSEIEGRLDPLYYSSLEKLQTEIVDRSKFGVSSVKEECRIIRGRFGHRPRNDPAYYNGKYPFIQTGDVVNASSSGEKIKYSQTLNELGLSTSKLFKSHRLLFTIAANIGDTAILDYDACFPDSIVAIEPKHSNVSIEYLNIYFKLLKPYIYDLAPFAAQRNLNNKQLEEFPIIIPPIDLQRKIIDLFNDCIKEKQNKQSHSKSLLESIDTYLLNELGIVLPQKDNSLKARMFTTKFSEVCGGRLDCELFKKEFKDCFVAIEKGKYKSILLKNVLTFLESGSRPCGGVNNISNGILSFGGEHVNTQFEVGYGTPKYISEEYHKKIILTETKLNDIVLVKDGATTGKIGIIENEECINQNINEHVFLLRSNSAIIDQHYLCYYLHSTVGQLEIEKEITGATVTGISKTSVKNLRIPLPPLSKQIEIADRIKKIRSQAKQLEIESEQILTDAKKEIEKMILGEE